MKNYVLSDKMHIWHPFTQAQTAPDPVCIVRGQGHVLFDADGKRYLDLISSWWVNVHGHAHPKIAAAIAAQAMELEHTIFADFTHKPAVDLAENLVKTLKRGKAGQLNRVFFSDNGSSAVEVGLKQALQYWKNNGKPQRNGFLAFDGAYHGDTVGAMSVGRSSRFFDSYKEFLFDVSAIPFPQTWPGDPDVEFKEKQSLAALESLLTQQGKNLAAIIVEPLVQGASGMRMCRPEFMQRAMRMAQDAGLLVIFDEVMTGFGRTGSFCAYEQCGVTPDILCLAKGLTGGFMPMSVTVCDEKIFDAFKGAGFDRALAHGHSYTANPLACAAANASLALFKTENSLQKSAAIGDWHRTQFMNLSGHPGAHNCRVTGSIAAIDIDMDMSYGGKLSLDLKLFFLNRGFMIRPIGQTIYLMPPYCTDIADLQSAYDVIDEALTAFGKSAIPSAA